MSDTSITKGIEEEYSLDEEEPEEDNTSVALLSAARKSVNLPAVSNKTTNPALARITTVDTRSTSKTKKKSKPAKESTDSSAQPRQAVNFLNSDKWSKDLRPPHLEDDEVFNTLSVEVAANNIMQWMTTKAMIASNDIKEKRSRSMLGREKPDEKIKPIKIEAGLDDAESSFKTQLKELHEYLVPIKWQ